MTGAGRPLRFLLLVIGGWIALRTVQLWPVDDPPDVIAALAPPAVATTRAAEAVSAPAIPGARPAAPTPLGSRPSLRSTRAAPFAAPPAGTSSRPLPDTDVPRPLPSAPATWAAVPAQPIFALPPRRQARPRIAGSLWLIARGDGPAAPFVPQLGGSQAGARLTYALGDARRIALSARVSTALASRQREAAVGIDWQPTRLPIHLVAEQRIAIEQARGGPALGLVAGLPPVPLGGGVTLDGYAQAGAVARDGVERYADGALRLSRPVATAGQVRLDLGLGAWVAAQPGAARLDAGPSATIVLPAGPRAIRLSLDWRHRVAGNARPDSGLALSLGTDF